MNHPESPAASKAALGVVCGTGAALCWALGFVAARHGIGASLSPLVIAMHRYVWPGLALLPVFASSGFIDPVGIGWRRGVVLALFGGLPLALYSYIGYLFVPLGHGGIIQPSCAALGGMLLAWLVLKEALPGRRVIGAVTMVAGLAVIGTEALRTMGGNAIVGDLLFVAAGVSFAVFGMLVRLWRIDALPAAIITSVLSLVGLPLVLFSYRSMVAAGLWENLLQAAIQGGLTGVSGTYLFARAVVLLGASRAVLFPSLVPPFTLLTGFFVLGEVPSTPQLIGLVIVVAGFQLTQRG
jgi:drug/metabolite transporter (DMT)-like permease